MNPNRIVIALLVASAGLVSPATSQTPSGPSHLEALPPTVPWDGKSRELIAPADDPWVTPCEKSGLTCSPSYDETLAWLRRLTAASPLLDMISLGKSPEGRDVWMVVASADRAFTPRALRETGKPILLVQAGIHSGEIDGKDAGMMLLRDITVRGEKGDLLDGAALLFIPILSVDGHERSSPHARINQRGPREMGWRTNARNLNLNRDYAKLDTPELQAVIRAIGEWQPDLYYDVHVTDGFDYQYDITLDCVGPHGYSPHGATWMQGTLFPRIWADLEAWGHIPGPMVFAINREDVTQGVVQWTGSPRFSNCYGDARHLPTVLIENHSLKPFDQRVLGTYVLLESTLRLLASQGDELRRAVALDRERRPDEIPVAWRPSSEPPEEIEWLGIESRRVESPVTGNTVVEWTGKPVTQTVRLVRIDEPAATVEVPTAYWIPPAWPEVIERLALHGIEMERLEQGRDVPVEMLRLTEVELGEAAYEGHVTVTCTPLPESHTWHFPPGSVRVPTDQPLGELAVLLLEPTSPDSFLQWGFFLEILQRTEYFEPYVMAVLAERMLEADPELKRAFEAALSADDELAADPRRRLEWFYERSPYLDERWRLYPVARER